ncbi:nuclear pore protein 84/107 [Diplogelasinospora grovesii]|uniref:Nuclear pore complex protein n=1 Tax=Diplogelasinospora grovesii TaxID=303347 RepID=A0AAN6NG98_9PEZI|nr:nuclear pore protein 84/107 [Diplogelasinospora grovesii]
MSPAFDFAAGFDGGSPSGSPSPARDPGQDDMAALEATYQDSSIRVGEEVEYFAGELDRYHTDLKGSAAEQRAQIYKLVDSFYTYTRRRADQLHERQAHSRSARGGSWQRGASADMDIDEVEDGDTTVSSEELRRVEEEAQTWDLLRRMLPLRYRDPTAPQPKIRNKNSSTDTRKSWWDEFLMTESTARERKIVLEWLQNSASHGPPVDEVVSELQQSAERGDILAHGWLHTRHKIKLQKSVNGYQGVLDPHVAGLAESHLGSNTLITQLDPDAITRQGRRLEPQDEFFERAIWLGCFEMLRRGCTMSEIRDWCSVRTELWRAATIAPLPLSNPEDEDVANWEPTSLILWRRMCYAAARDGGTSEYDRAVYGLLAGDIASVEKVCKSWDDFLFAHYNALLRTQFDGFLVSRCGDGQAVGKIAQQFPAFDAVQHHGTQMMVGKRLISTLETDARTASEATRILKVLQGAIIANDLDRHLLNQGVALSEHANAKETSKLIFQTTFTLPKDIKHKYANLVDHDNLRILAHIFIIVSTLDRLGGQLKDEGPLHPRYQAQEHIIASYISYLRLAALDEMLPLYCSKLHGPRLYESLSRNLIHIVGVNARMHQLTVMRKLGLDLAEFAKTQPQLYLGDVHDQSLRCEAKGKFKILEDGPATLKYGRIVKPDFFGDDADFVDLEDELIIRSMEWLMLVPGLFIETCSYAIRAYKYFLKRMRLRAARTLSNRVQGREIIRSKARLSVRSSSEESVSDWFDEFANAELPEDFLEECNADKEELTTVVRNMWELECLVKALDSMETLSSLASLNREENNNSRDMWNTVGQEVRVVKRCMQPVLKNWLLVVNEVDHDFQELRQAYIPETVLAFISCLHFAGTSLARDNLLECMELAAVIAEKGSDVAQEFVKCGRMKELVEAFASCSKALAIWTSDKKGLQTSSKKMREMGWSRELWSVK